MEMKIITILLREQEQEFLCCRKMKTKRNKIWSSWTKKNTNYL